MQDRKTINTQRYQEPKVMKVALASKSKLTIPQEKPKTPRKSRNGLVSFYRSGKLRLTPQQSRSKSKRSLKGSQNKLSHSKSNKMIVSQKENLKDNKRRSTSRSATPTRTRARQSSKPRFGGQTLIPKNSKQWLSTYIEGIKRNSSPPATTHRPKKIAKFCQYYSRKLEQALNNPYSEDQLQKIFRQHFLQSHLFFRINFKPVEDYIHKQKNLNIKLKQSVKTLVLDLDQTLLHCADDNQPCDVQIPIQFSDGQQTTMLINIRPHAQQFLKQMSKIFQIVIFTASQQQYAVRAVQLLDPHKQFVSHLLTRQNCIFTDHDFYVKDLRILGKPLQDVIIVDNALISFILQLDNGIPIIPFTDYKLDQQLLELMVLLRQLSKEKDVRPKIRKHFRFQQYRAEKHPQQVFEKLYKR